MVVSEGSGWFRLPLDEAYRPLPFIYLSFATVWYVAACCWTINTYKNRHFQTSNLQWMLAVVPWIKALQLAQSFLFWYSCVNFKVCSLWMSFGAYVTGVLFQTISLVSFFLISHGYCIMYERLSVTERRSTAVLASVFYLTLVGYRASIPYFSVLLLINYFMSFYVIFRHISQNLLVLREQFRFVQYEDIRAMHDALRTKYCMFKKFQAAMQTFAVSEIVMLINLDDSLENYWFRLLVREWAQLCIFFFIGWTFRSQELAPCFSIMPLLKTKGKRKLPPIYSIEMDAAEFKDFSSRDWHIGMPTISCGKSMKESVLVVIQQPGAYRLNSTVASPPKEAHPYSVSEESY